jgi:hypothetical protein
MRPIRPLGATYTGLIISGFVGGLGLGLLSAAMFLFRAHAEPVVRIILPLVASRHGPYRYNPDTYFFWPSLVGFLAILWVALSSLAVVRKPAEDKQIEAALKARHRQAARGAPLEPK